jgi:hypothetical protein
MRLEDRVAIWILMSVGLVAVLSAIVGTIKKWWRNGIDIEFLMILTLFYCVWVFVEHVLGKRK